MRSSIVPLHQENQIDAVSQANSSICSDDEESQTESVLNKIALPNAEYPSYGDINVQESRDVHFGSRVVYENCQINVHNYSPCSAAEIPQAQESEIRSISQNHDKESIAETLTSSNSGGILCFGKCTAKKVLIIGGFLSALSVGIFLSIIVIVTITDDKSERTEETTTLFTQPSTSTTNIPWNSTTGSSTNPTTYFPSSSESSAENLTIISRKEWNAKNYRYERVKLLNPEYVIIGHSGYRCLTKAECMMHVAGTQHADHDIHKLNDIRFNFLVGGDGNIYEGRGWNVVGQLTRSYNDKSLCVGLLGYFKSMRPTQKQVKTLENFLEFAVLNNKVIGNYKLTGKSQVELPLNNPGKKVLEIIEKWDHWVNMTESSTAPNPTNVSTTDTVFSKKMMQSRSIVD